MSIISSRQTPTYRLNVDLIFVLFALTLVLFILVPSNRNIHSSIRTAPRIFDSLRADVSTTGGISFAADHRYWSSNCSQGSSSDSRCEQIFARTQSCSINLPSAYCSEYKNYLQKYRSR